jgi:PhnB protein
MRKEPAMTAKPRHVPEGYHSLTPYIIVDGAARAIAFYQTAFGASEVMRLDGPGGKVGHAEMTIGGSKFMLADEFPDFDAHGPGHFGGSPITLHLYVEDADASMARAVAAGATLVRPAANQFYGDRIGSVKDPFGHVWYLATRKENFTVEELQRRSAAHLKQQGGG